MHLPDTWRDSLLDASFDGLPLDVLSTDDGWSQALAEYSAPRRDGATIAAQGQEPRSTRCTLIFWDVDEDAPNHLARAVAFIERAMTAREARPFTHPLWGSYQAFVRDVQARASASEPNVVMVDASFVEHLGEPPVFAFEADPAASLAQVTVLAGDLEAAPDAGPATLAVATEARTVAEQWSTSTDLAVRDVNADLSALSDRVSDALLELDYATNLDRFPVVRTLHRLHDTLRRAAEQFRRAEPRIVAYTVAGATSLRGVAVSLYGAAAAAGGRYDDLLRLNDLADPTYLAPGTQLRVLATAPVGPGVRGSAR